MRRGGNDLVRDLNLNTSDSSRSRELRSRRYQIEIARAAKYRFQIPVSGHVSKTRFQIPDSGYRISQKPDASTDSRFQIPDSRFRTTKASADSRFQIPGTGLDGSKRPVQIPYSRFRGQDFADPTCQYRFQFPRVQCKDWWTLVQIPGSSFQSPSFQNTPTQIPVSRFQGQFPVDLAHQYRFQISGSKGWSGSQIRRKQNPGSSIQIGPSIQVPVSRLQNTGRMAREEWQGEITDTDSQILGRAGRGRYRKAGYRFQNTGFIRYESK